MSEKVLNLSLHSLVNIKDLALKFFNLKAIALSIKSIFLQECGHQSENENLASFNYGNRIS